MAEPLLGLIIIDKKLKNFIPPLSKEEFSQLEENILQEGCRDPLVVWEKSEQELILADGFNRYKICTTHHLPFSIEKKTFRNEEEARDYMINNQLGRCTLISWLRSV